jgi:hypothetical protein
MFDNANSERSQLKGTAQSVADRPDSLSPHLIMAADAIEIKDKPQKAQAAPEAADKAAKPKDEWQMVMELPKDKVGPGMQQSQEAVKEFVQAKRAGNATDALSQTAPKFEAAINQSDKDFGKTMGEKWAALNSARREVSMAQSVGMLEQQKAQAIIGKIDPEKRNSAMAMTGLMMDKAVPKETKDHLRGVLKNYPGLIESVDKMIAIDKQGEQATKAHAASPRTAAKSSPGASSHPYNLCQSNGASRRDRQERLDETGRRICLQRCRKQNTGQTKRTAKASY